MNLTIFGLWHLGCVTAACCAERFTVRGLDLDLGVVKNLKQGLPPISEPGLQELTEAGLNRGTLAFSNDLENVCATTELLWVCFDTPVDEDDNADVEFVLNQVRRAVAHLPQNALVLLSSQLPVGTCRKLRKEFPTHRFACSPENLQLGKALDAFRKPARVIIGASEPESRRQLDELFRPFCENLIFVRPESAEMVKHALNSFLALSVSFANEIGRMCEWVEADAKEVESGLKSDVRIGPRAYLSPGAAFAGGTLARDVSTLSNLGKTLGENLVLIPAIKESNDQHKNWPSLKLERVLTELRGKTVAVLGLTYKPFTDTLRRSSSVELSRHLAARGCKVKAFDPAIKELQMNGVSLCQSAAAALTGAEAVVMATPWPEFRQLDWGSLVREMKTPIVLDAAGFIREQIRSVPGVQYHTVGSSA